MTRRRVHLSLAALAVSGLVAGTLAVTAAATHDNDKQFRATLIGFNEVPATNTTGHASLRLDVTSDKLTFTLRYAGLTANPAAAHIHVGQRGVNGGVSVFFCGGGGQAACPAATSGTVTGTIGPENVIGPTAQNFPAGDLAPLIRAIRAGVTYANMHTATLPGGEIRGQITDDD